MLRSQNGQLPFEYGNKRRGEFIMVIDEKESKFDKLPLEESMRLFADTVLGSNGTMTPVRYTSINGMPATYAKLTLTQKGFAANGHAFTIRGNEHHYSVFAWMPATASPERFDVLRKAAETLREVGEESELIANKNLSEQGESIDRGGAMPARSEATSSFRYVSPSQGSNKFESVEVALMALRDDSLPPGANADQNSVLIGDSIRSAAFDYLEKSSLSQSRSERLRDGLIAVVSTTQGDDDLCGRVLRSQMAFSEELCLLMAKNWLGDFSCRKHLLPWIRNHHPPGLCSVLMDHVQTEHEIVPILEHYPETGRLILERSLTQHNFNILNAKLVKRIELPPFAEVHDVLLDVLRDSETDTQLRVMKYLVSKPVSEAPEPLRREVSRHMAREGIGWVNSNRLPSTTLAWIMPNDVAELDAALQAASEYQFNDLAIAFARLDYEAIERSTVQRLEHVRELGMLGRRIDEDPVRAKRVQKMVMEATNPADEAHASACAELLGIIGDEDCVIPMTRLLQYAESNRSYSLKRKTETAMNALRARLGSRYNRAIARGNRKLRLWKSGSHQVEAVLAGREGSQAILRKSDGTEVKVPIARLSDADQAYINKLEPQ